MVSAHSQTVYARDGNSLGKFELPPNFYERVLELEHQIEKQNKDVDVLLLRELIDLFSVGYLYLIQNCSHFLYFQSAIEYFGIAE